MKTANPVAEFGCCATLREPNLVHSSPYPTATETNHIMTVEPRIRPTLNP